MKVMKQPTVPENLDIARQSSGGGGADSGQCDDAEALRAQIKEMSGFTDALMTSQELAAENPRVLEAEVERLRAALSEFVRYGKLRLCKDDRHRPLRFPLCPYCQLEARIEEAEDLLERKP